MAVSQAEEFGLFTLRTSVRAFGSDFTELAFKFAGPVKLRGHRDGWHLYHESQCL